MSSNKTVIAVDAMGGDLGPSVVVPGAIEAARQTGAKILLVGNEATLDGELNRLSPSGVDLVSIGVSTCRKPAPSKKSSTARTTRWRKRRFFCSWGRRMSR